MSTLYMEQELEPILSEDDENKDEVDESPVGEAPIDESPIEAAYTWQNGDIEEEIDEANKPLICHQQEGKLIDDNHDQNGDDIDNKQQNANIIIVQIPNKQKKEGKKKEEEYESSLVLAILSCIFCNICCGLFAICYSCEAKSQYYQGNFERYRRYRRNSNQCMIIACCCGILGLLHLVATFSSHDIAH